MSMAAQDNLKSQRISVSSMTSGTEKRTDGSALATAAERKVPNSLATCVQPLGPLMSAIRRATNVCLAMLMAVSSIAFQVFADNGAAFRLNHSPAIYLLPS